MCDGCGDDDDGHESDDYAADDVKDGHEADDAMLMVMMMMMTVASVADE